MTPRQRIEAAFAGRKIDRIPIHHVGFSSDVASALLGREAYVGGGIQRWREARALYNGPDAHAEFLERSYRDAIDLARLCGNDMVRPTYWRYPRKPTRKLDENTYVFEDGDPATWTVLKYDPPSEQCALLGCRQDAPRTFEAIEAEVAAGEKAVADYRPDEGIFAFDFQAKAELGDEYAIRIGGVGIGIAHDQIWLEAIALRPDLVRRALDVQLETALRNLEFLAGKGFTYFFGGYDFASQTGPMFSPATFRELILPPLRTLSAACRRLGVKHLFASDGNLWPVAGPLFGESGIDGYYEIDRRAGMDLRRLRREHPDLTLIGNISSHTVHLAGTDEIASEVRDCLESAAEAGRIIAGVSNYVVPGTPVDHFITVLETIRACQPTGP